MQSASCPRAHSPACWIGLLTFSAWASKDFRLLVTFFSSSSRSLALLRREAHTALPQLSGHLFVSVVLLVLPFRQLSPLLGPLQLSLQDHQLSSHLKPPKNGSNFKMDSPPPKPRAVFALTSSYLRSASSAMCFASFSCISWISIFSSSFIARFSITFMPLWVKHGFRRIPESCWLREPGLGPTSRSRPRPSPPPPVSAAPRPAAPEPGPAPPPPAGCDGSELRLHPPPEEEQNQRTLHPARKQGCKMKSILFFPGVAMSQTVAFVARSP